MPADRQSGIVGDYDDKALDALSQVLHFEVPSGKPKTLDIAVFNGVVIKQATVRRATGLSIRA